MNAASFATGAFPDATGFFGNVVWQPTASGRDAAGKPVDFAQPVFSEDYGVLDGLKQGRSQLLLVETLFGAAHAKGLTTVTIGKTGAAYMQDNARGGWILDERTAWPLDFARALQAAGVALDEVDVVGVEDAAVDDEAVLLVEGALFGRHRAVIVEAGDALRRGHRITPRKPISLCRSVNRSLPRK